MTTVYMVYCDAPHSFYDDVVLQCPDHLRHEIAVEKESLQTGIIPTLDSATNFQIFSLAFSVVVFCFLLGRGLGAVLQMLRPSRRDDF